MTTALPKKRRTGLVLERTRVLISSNTYDCSTTKETAEMIAPTRRWTLMVILITTHKYGHSTIKERAETTHP